jgi:diguanylate cyclase (GGDEF)-like protein
MTRSIFYVTPDATVRTAVEMLRSHQADVIAVVEAGTVVGLLDALHLCLYDGEVSVREAISGPPLTLPADLPLAEAARRMRGAGLNQVPVVEEGRFAGMLSEHDLLNNWGAVNDPLTGLPVQYQLRHWIASRMAAGREVVILFLDLNNFGALNKQRGHVFGDQVLRAVAQSLKELADPDLDYLCRYGGDEFAIATVRALAEARQLAEQARERVGQIRLNGEDTGIGIAIGLAGGRRSRPRPDTHVSATLDDLLTRASTASTAAKHARDSICVFQNATAPSPGEAQPTGTRLYSPVPRAVLMGYEVQPAGEGLEVRVALRAAEEVREQREPADESTVARALVEATARCLEQFVDNTLELQIEDTYEYTTPHGLPCVGATVTLRRGDEEPERLVGASAIRGDIYRTYINAVLDATNRRLQIVEPGAAPAA